MRVGARPRDGFAQIPSPGKGEGWEGDRLHRLGGDSWRGPSPLLSSFPGEEDAACKPYHRSLRSRPSSGASRHLLPRKSVAKGKGGECRT